MKPHRIRIALGCLQGLIGIAAFGGGWYGLSGANGVPLFWLEGSPFPTYAIPSLFLLIVVGGSFLSGAITVFARHSHARPVSFLTGILLILWITVQVLVIGFVSWLQPAMAIAGIAVLLLARRLPAAEGAAGRIRLKS